MKAPDKIYLCADTSRFYDWSNVPFEKGGNVEYIRKDALLEWAKEMKRICKGAEPIEKAYQTVIDKIESL